MTRRRVWIDRITAGMAAAGACFACGVLVALVASILVRGLPSVHWQFLTEPIRLVGASGGIYYNVIGTLILIVSAAAVSTPISLGLALVQGFYLRHSGARRGLGMALYALNGVPSILFGILGLIVFVKHLGWGKSWLSGGVLLGFMITPTVAVALVERIRSVPAKYLEAARGLGLSESQTVRAVILPQSFAGLATGLLLGLVRAAGETAPIMFTATIFAGVTVPHGIKESPVLTLPYHIFVLAQDSFDPHVADKVWGAASVLLMLAMALSAAGYLVRLKSHEEGRHA